MTIINIIFLLQVRSVLTFGMPFSTRISAMLGRPSVSVVLALAAAAERYSAHPLADAVRVAAKERGVAAGEPADFEALPGVGVRARVNGHTITVGAPRMTALDATLATVAGGGVALEAAHVALMREDWTLVPEALMIARRTMRVVKLNIVFTAVYNLVGLALAALGFLPLVFAAAAQSLPDVGILGNSSRLLRQRSGTRTR